MSNSIDEVKRFVARFDGSAAFVINHSGTTTQLACWALFGNALRTSLRLLSWPTQDSNISVRPRQWTSHVPGVPTSTFLSPSCAISLARIFRWLSSVACFGRRSTDNAPRI